MSDEIDIAEIFRKSVFLLGAGFSRKAGCLTSAQMFGALKNEIFDKTSKNFTSAQKDALKFLISCLHYHSEWRTMESGNNFTFAPNIEELALLIRRVKNRESFLPYPITGSWADKLVLLESAFSNESSDGYGLFESLERELKKLLKNEWLAITEETNFEYLKPLTEFLKEHSQEEFKLDIFTLNNDTILESYFTKEGDIPWRGFSNGRWVDVNPDDHNDSNARINLYKLHGSVDWVRLTDMDTWEVEKLEDAENSELAENIEEKHNPYIIFGQGTKSFSVEPFFSLIHHFNKLLNSKDKRYFFVIGYSFFDPYINNLIFNAVKGFKKLVIVNPSFAPNEIFQMDANKEFPAHDQNDFYRAIYKSGLNAGNLTDFLREIQRNSFYSEMPEFNYIGLSAENLEYLPLKAETFLEEFFGNKGELLKKYIRTFESQLQDNEPFG